MAEILPSDDNFFQARSLWLSNSVDIDVVEKLYRKELSTSEDKDGENARSNAMERLSLILCQSGRAQEAEPLLRSVGYKCRLSSCVLDYGVTENEVILSGKEKSVSQIFDNFLSSKEINVLREAFENIQSNYWLEHKYEVEPPSPYVSYVIPILCIEKHGFMGHLITKCISLLKPYFPLLEKACFVEMWAHNRPHASGHQMHFDSDNEGLGGVRNPIISTILYLSEGAGGPSLVTNQKLMHGQLATKGWMCLPKEKRLVAFDGKVLHGVVPGKGNCNSKSQRRVTVMLAFWNKIQVRDDTKGAAQSFPEDRPWAKILRQPFTEDNFKDDGVLTRAQPHEVKPVYETLHGEPWKREMGMPDYEHVFQGF
jgi:hypothetical protein